MDTTTTHTTTTTCDHQSEPTSSTLSPEHHPDRLTAVTLQALFHNDAPKSLVNYFGRHSSQDLTRTFVALIKKFLGYNFELPEHAELLRLQKRYATAVYIKNIIAPNRRKRSDATHAALIRKNWLQVYKIIKISYSLASPSPAGTSDISILTSPDITITHTIDNSPPPNTEQLDIPTHPHTNADQPLKNGNTDEAEICESDVQGSEIERSGNASS